MKIYHTYLSNDISFLQQIGLWKAILCAGFLAGLVLNIQPPFLFAQNETTLDNSSNKFDQKYIGVILAIVCTIAGSLNNIVIKRVSR